VGFGVLECELQ
jgi:hypothetical protein